ncbi:hypothetical protein TL16_g08858 [Triparma laevis f. inornata]|uniref:Uncharacterized protein n=1 Tax=Triparma laevis f. inornata TaxID=1714386 RepID=A0A9W7AZX4_9STRA|nr:hypothetical protein TL16_g08858 [Triparma laevis f. inornata]
MSSPTSSPTSPSNVAWLGNSYNNSYINRPTEVTSNLSAKINKINNSQNNNNNNNAYFQTAAFQDDLQTVILERDALKKENETLRAEITVLRNSSSPNPTQTFRTARRFSNFQSAKSDGMTFRELVKVKNEVVTSIDVHENVEKVREAVMGGSKSVSSTGSMKQKVLHSPKNSQYSINLWEMRDGAKIYEFLLELKEEKDVSGEFTGRIEIESISEEDLEKLQTEEEFKASRSMFSTSLNVVRIKVCAGLISLTPLPYGQSTLTVSGELAVDKRLKPALIEDKEDDHAQHHFELTQALKTTLGKSMRGLGLGSSKKLIESIDDDDDDSESNSSIREPQLSSSSIASGSLGLTSMASILSKVGHGTDQKYTRIGSVTEVVKTFKKIAVMFSKKFFDPMKVDRSRHKQFISDIPTSLPSPHTISKEFLSSYEELIHGMKFKRFHVNPGDHPLVDMRYETSSHSVKTPYISATALVHCSAEQLLSYIMCFDSFERTANFRKVNGELAERYNYKIDREANYRDEVWINEVKMPNPLSNRKFESWVTWDEVPSKDPRLKNFRIGWRPCEDYIEYTHEILKHLRKEEDLRDRTHTFHAQHMLKSQVVRAASKGFYDIESVSPTVCKLTLLTRDDLGTTVHMSSEARRRREMSDFEFRFRRNGKEVDKELRGWLIETMMPNYPKAKLGGGLTEAQQSSFENCREMAETHKWYAIRSPYLRVQMSVDDQSKEGATLGTGRAIAVLDCGAEEAAAWYFDYCSVERNREGREWGQPARLCYFDSPHERHFASLTKFPFPIKNREAIFKQIWDRVDDKTIDVLLESMHEGETVDYGFSMDTLRATSMGLFRCETLEPLGGVPQCKVTLTQFFDAGGSLPRWLITKKMPEILSVVVSMQDLFNRDAEVDEAVRLEYAALIEGYEGEYSKEEEAMVERGVSFREKVTDSVRYKELPVDSFLVAKSVHVDNESLVAGSAHTVIDGSLENVAAYEYLKMSRGQLKVWGKKGGLEKFTKRINDHSQYYVQARDLKVPGLTVREWRTKVVWKRLEEDTIVVVYEDTNDLDEELGQKNLRGTATTIFTMERLAPMGKIPQTLVKMTTRVDVAGSVPSFVMNRLAKAFTRNLSKIREDFDRSKEFDRENRAIFVQAVTSFASMPRLQGVRGVEDAFKASMDAVPMAEQENIKGFAMVDLRVHVPEGGGKCWGRAEGEVPSTLEEIASFFWTFDSRAYIAINGNEGRKVTSKKSAFKKSILKYRVIGSGGEKKLRQAKRIFYNEMTFNWIDQNTVIIALEPIDVDDELIRQQNTKKDGNGPTIGQQRRMSVSEKIKSSFVGDDRLFVKGREKTAIRLTRVGERRTTVEFVTELELGSSLQTKLVREVLEKSLNELGEIQIYFQLEKGLKHMDIDNGRILGHAIMWRKAKVNKIAHMLRILSESQAMDELVKQYDWMPLFFMELRKGKLGLNSSVGVKLACVTEKDAKQIGKNMIVALKSRKTAEAGILQWRRQNPSMDELLKEHPWLESLLVVVGRGVVKAAAWGLMWRVSIGAILSLLDLSTDIYVGWEFFSRQRWVFGGLTVGTIVLSFFLQLVVVAFQNAKKGWGRLTQEAFFVISGLKTPVDAYRVAIGAEKEEQVMFDPLMEMMYTKSIELFAESIPGCVIQIIGYMASDEKLEMALVSIIVSALTAGFTCAQISYDMDTDPVKRSQKPHFYGYVPDVAASRTIVFVTMIFISSVMLLVKSLAVALLIRVGFLYFVGYIVVDIGVFFLYKFWLGDFRYYLPLKGWWSIFLSVIVRIIEKVIVDFTAIVHFRHPSELGGLYFTLNILNGLLALMVAIYITGQKGEDVEILWKLFGVGLGATLVLWTVFLRTIKKEYTSTFFSLESSWKSNIKMFTTSNDDAVKITIFSCHEIQWLSIREEVKTWILLNWENWKEDKPEWFTEDRRRSIPGEFKPNEASLLLKTFRTERRSGRVKVKQREDYSGVV